MGSASAMPLACLGLTKVLPVFLGDCSQLSPFPPAVTRLYCARAQQVTSCTVPPRTTKSSEGAALISGSHPPNPWPRCSSSGLLSRVSAEVHRARAEGVGLGPYCGLMGLWGGTSGGRQRLTAREGATRSHVPRVRDRGSTRGQDCLARVRPTKPFQLTLPATPT